MIIKHRALDRVQYSSNLQALCLCLHVSAELCQMRSTSGVAWHYSAALSVERECALVLVKGCAMWKVHCQTMLVWPLCWTSWRSCSSSWIDCLRLRHLHNAWWSLLPTCLLGTRQHEPCAACALALCWPVSCYRREASCRNTPHPAWVLKVHV